jgi:hypothetical protein
MTSIEKEYSAAVRRLTGTARMQIVAALYGNLHSSYELQVQRAKPDITGEALRIAVARRMYRHDPRTLALIHRMEREK